AARLSKGRFLEPQECLDIGFEGFGGGAYFEELFAVNPLKLFTEMRRVLRENGVHLMLGSPAKLEKNGSKITSVAVDGGRLIGDVFIATGGAESREILKPAAYDPQVLPALGMAMIFETGGAKVVRYPT